MAASAAHGGLLERLSEGLQLEIPEHGFVCGQPASKWDESLICGNGTIGLTMPGDALKDRIIFSHEELFLPRWPPTAAPDLRSRLDEIRELLRKGDGATASGIAVEEGSKVGIPGMIWPNPPVPACQLELEALDTDAVTAHARRTDFETGEITAAYRTHKGVFHRSAFASRKDHAAVIRISSPSGSKLNYRMRLAPLPPKGSGFNPDEFAESSAGIRGHWLSYRTEFTRKWDGSLKGFEFLAKVIARNGTLSNHDGWLHVTGADEILVFEDIRLSRTLPLQGRDALRRKLDAIGPDYAALLADHAAIHSEMFNRFSFDLGDGRRPARTSEELLASSSFDNPNPDLLVQVLKACRYNLISATGKLPPTLQGLWSGTWTPMWSGDYTLNGNAPCAIACGLNTNLQEATDAYLGMMNRNVPFFERNARELYGAEGVFVPSRMSDRGDVYHYSKYHPHLFWFAGSSWTAHFYYDKWLHTRDEDFLKREAIPFMLDAYTFLREILHQDDRGGYHFIPSYSAENRPAGAHPCAANATHDVAAMKQLLRNLITLARGGYLPEDRADEFEQVLKGLPPYAIDDDGGLNEWLWPGLRNNNSHRHASHLYPLFDGVDDEFVGNPGLREAAKAAIGKRLAFRRDKKGGAMAFGLVQLGLAAAHLGDAPQADECINWLANSYWTPAFGSYHNPGSIFNVDICGGIPAVVSYMLVQSTEDTITLLPCLPDSWPDGRVKGIRTRGGFEVDLEWKNGALVKASVRSIAGRPCTIIHNGTKAALQLQKGERRDLEL